MSETEKKEEELQDAARRVVSLLQSALSQPAVRDRVSANQQKTTQEVPQQSTSLEQNMARSFPGLFGKNSGRKVTGKRGTHSTFTDLKRKLNTVKSFPVQFYLVNKYMEKTPKALDELTLLQAGMGRRTINITDDADHLWLSRKLEETYSKMADLKGAWMLYKAVGSGQRKLCVVPPEAEGYSGAYLNTVARGKSTLFIVPLQGTLDTSPLPYSAKEFEKMAKASCHTCSESMPVQLLAAHVASCKTVELLTDSDEQTSVFSLDSPVMDISMQNSPDDTPSIETYVTVGVGGMSKNSYQAPLCGWVHSSSYAYCH